MSKPLPFVAEFYRRPDRSLELQCLTTVDGERTRIFDVNLSKRHGYIFDEVGGGRVPVAVSGIYYATKGVPLAISRSRLIIRAARQRNRTHRLSRLPRRFACEGDLLGWLECNAIQETAVWCEECRDWSPGDQLCEHCWWCYRIGWYSTPSERCGCETRVRCEEPAGACECGAGRETAEKV